MSKNKAIEIFLRVRPKKNPYKGLTIDEEQNKVNIYMPKGTEQGAVNNTKEHYSFEFQKVFGMDTKQETIFNHIAKDVCDSAIDGFNGTIFAYGQTGSGKTFTMTGGTERYVDRGIIPRTISYLFDQQNTRQDLNISVSISYLEIYGNSGYDLLDENHNNKKIEDLPKVVPRETQSEQIILSGLSIHKAQTEEDALNLLFIGDTNRVVCETPMNDASTRSHCIFIVMLECRQPGSDIKTRSTIHLVDLSGSERIGKTGVEGKMQQEARDINLSLHYLEQVIVCLNRAANGENLHIPYRNSLMTLVLRDSLGGNCKTRMIATMSPDFEQMDESVSTCKFSQRVALIKNYVIKNESVDPAVIIDRLKRENAQLKAELSMLRGEDVKDNLDAEDIENCRKKVQEFVESKDPSSMIILKDRLQINECFYYFKHIYNDLLKKGGGKMSNDSGVVPSKKVNNFMENTQDKQQAQDNAQYLDEIKRLKMLIAQRDNEIMILLNLVNKNTGTGQSLVLPIVRGQQGATDNSEANGMMNSIMRESKPMSFPDPQEQLRNKQKDENRSDAKKSITSSLKQNSTRMGSDLSQTTNRQMSGDMTTEQENSILSRLPEQDRNNQIQNLQEVQKMLLYPVNLSNDQLRDRNHCFDLFRKSYRKNEVMEENKQILKEKIEVAKGLVPIVNKSRDQINELKNRIEALRKEVALRGLVEGNDYQHPDEKALTDEIEIKKKIYKENCEKLKEVKSEVERIQKLLERNATQLQKDFEQWLEVMLHQRQAMLAEIQENRSDVSNQSTQSNTKVKDKNVEKKLQEFYKARDEIYKN